MSIEYPLFKAAAVQAGSVFKDKPTYFDSKATLKKAVELIEEAGRNGAKLIVFPETFLPAYPYWSLTMQEAPEFCTIWKEYLRHSVEVPSAETKVLCEAAKKVGAYVVTGINERDRRYEGRMYNSILYISPKGEVVGVHRKINITVNELLFHTRGDGGDNIKIFETEMGKLGGLICGEHFQHSLLHSLIVQGMQVSCSLWPGSTGMDGLKGITDAITRGLCVSGKTFAVLAASFIPEEDRPRNFYSNNAFDSLAGGSGIIDPVGKYLAGPVYGKEVIVYADIDLNRIPIAKAEVNLNGIYSRWDILRLNVRQEQYEPILPMDPEKTWALTEALDKINELASKIQRLESKLAALEHED